MGDRLDSFATGTGVGDAKLMERDDAGLQLFDDTASTLTTDLTEIDDGTDFSISAGEVTVSGAGSVEVTCLVAVGTPVGAGSNRFEFYLEQDSGSGFSEVSGTRKICDF